ncbi:MAG TPA: D-glycero-beta-D-manno-heptose 1-phosphate adenylyltransferase [Gemmatimonas aurantiaca]|uniref:D-glycero-beta-D-manno-heptose 1-phosphate adenylyltransferase n=2 Tax=Gemmatimonas aurantiaca TaxID=173480 RepID=C1A8Q2_GEMAT|nr:D-glycero-beta-D-manno-heptose 1-phosphate adenylyltransferase [Gemmatimonas aurantiaca]BAH38612.1 D-beta-D-heptose 1-phosphate adenosyltransferase [Gemmatimonas aurantiaca T-27]HCT57266.1 D-glycero-beta-D-manno-heptose 1-phosphate adenylyltransferase [Gemmatimonas aurantiaca]
MVTRDGPRRPESKVMGWDAAAEWRQQVRGAVVFTNGVFDLVHPGHVEVLDMARREGAALIVGVNSDASVQRLKGPTRPVRTVAERAMVLAALEAVDAVVVFGEDTPQALVECLQPDVIVKGGDYAPETIVGADVVTARGGRVVVVPLVPDQSTTSIIEKLRV